MPFQHSCKVQNVVAASHSIHHDSRQRLESSRRLVKSCSDRFRAREICEYFVTPVITAVPSCLFWCKSALDASGSGPPYGHWTRAGRLQRCFLALEVGPCAELVPHSAWNWVTWSQTSRLSSPPVAHQADYLSGFVKVLSSCQRQGKRIWDHVGTNWTFFVLFSPVAHAVHRHASGYSGARCHPSGAVFHL